MPTRYVDDTAGWDRVAGAMYRAWDSGQPMGLDTEFFGVDLKHDSCVGRSRVHIWSVALNRQPLVRLPRGHYVAEPLVLPAAALEHYGIRECLEAPELVKPIHNQPVDDHSLNNHGVRLRGAVNTLEALRFFRPERVASAGGRGFGLDAAGEDELGIAKTEHYTDIFTEAYDDPYFTHRKESRCECGAVPCHRRGAGHVRGQVVIETRHDRTSMRPVALETVVPGHPLWDRAREYAGRDSLIALGLFVKLTQERRMRVLPW